MSALKLLEEAKDKSVLLVGERIIDVYHYCTPLGRPTKDAIVSVQAVSTEAFNGGIEAAANHVVDLCRCSVWEAGDTTKKTRFVEQSHVRKLFEYYDCIDKAIDWLHPDYAAYDQVVVIDYGHGMATPEFIERVTREAKHLSINVQTNAGNYGYNLCTKYPRADYLCVDESEARLATQNRTGPIEQSLLSLAKHAEKVVITMGKAGAIGFSHEESVVHAPARTDAIRDTMGAGDAFFACSALVARDGCLRDVLAVGNAAGAIKSGIVGHQRSVTKDELFALLQETENRAGEGRARRRAV